MNYSIKRKRANSCYGFKPGKKNSHPVFKFFFITKSDLKRSIEDHKLIFIDAIETLDNFGIRYSVKVNLISSHGNLNTSIYLLTSDCYRVLSYENVDSLISTLHACGYHVKKRDLNIIPCFSGI